MRRRELVTLIGGAAAGVGRLPRARSIAGAAADGDATRCRPQRHAQHGCVPPRPAETGYVEGQNVAIEYRYGDGAADRMAPLAADLVRQGQRLIAAPKSGAAAKHGATQTIPIVFHHAKTRSSSVSSQPSPGPAATPPDMNFSPPRVIGKRLGLLELRCPRLARVGVLVNPADAQTASACSRDCRRPPAPSACKSRCSRSAT